MGDRAHAPLHSKARETLTDSNNIITVPKGCLFNSMGTVFLYRYYQYCSPDIVVGSLDKCCTTSVRDVQSHIVFWIYKKNVSHIKKMNIFVVLVA